MSNRKNSQIRLQKDKDCWVIVTPEHLQNLTGVWLKLDLNNKIRNSRIRRQENILDKTNVSFSKKYFFQKQMEVLWIIIIFNQYLATIWYEYVSRVSVLQFVLYWGSSERKVVLGCGSTSGRTSWSGQSTEKHTYSCLILIVLKTV